MRPITQSQHETSDQNRDITPLEASREDSTRKSEQIIITKRLSQDTEDEIEVTKGKPREDHANSLVEELNEEHELANERVVGAEDLVGVGKRINGSEEGTVQPTPTLQDEIGHFSRHVGLTRSGLDVLQDPSAVPLGNELEAENTIFSQVHVCREDICVCTMHLLTGKVLLQRALAALIVLECNIAVSRERTGKHRDETKGRLQRLVKNVGHLVFKVLGRDQRVEQFLAVDQHSLDLTASTSTHRLEIERFPELVDRVLSGLCTGIDKDTDVRIKNGAESLEEPTMRVDLLLILFLQAEEHLHWGVTLLNLDDTFLDVQSHLGGVLVNMSSDILSVDGLLGNSILVATHGGEDSTSPGVDLATTIADDANDDLLPSLLAPRLAAISAIHVLDILDDTHHCSRKQLVFFVVHGNYDEQLSVAGLREQPLAQRETLSIEIRGIASSCRVTHVRELITLWGLRVRHLVQQSWWNGAVQHEVAVEQLHLLDCLPTPNWSRTRCWEWCVFICSTMWWVIIWMWLRPMTIWVQNWPIIMVILPIITAVLRVVLVQRMGILWRWVVRLIKVGIVVFFGVYNVRPVVAVMRVVFMLRFVRLVVPVRIM